MEEYSGKVLHYETKEVKVWMSSGWEVWMSPQRPPSKWFGGGGKRYEWRRPVASDPVSEFSTTSR
jgi:hypothetical protein